MIKKIFREKWLVSSIASIAFCIFILPITESLAFSTSGLNHRSIIYSYVLKLLFSIFLFFIFYFLLIFFEKISENNPRYKTWLKISLIYFLIMVVFFVLIYPGQWVWDEFGVLSVVKSYTLDFWQNYITNIYYTFCLYIIPTGVGIVLFQIIFSSFVVGYIISSLQQLFKNVRIAYLLIIPFLFIPVILNNFYPLRLTIYSYLEILFIGNLLILQFKLIKSNKYFDLFFFITLITLLSSWRSEGIFYLLLIPYIFIKLNIFGNKRYKKIETYALSSAAIAIVFLGYLGNVITTNVKYQLPISINPLSTMVQKTLSGEKTTESLASINKVIDINILKKSPDCSETPSFWAGAVKDNFEKYMNEYNSAFIYIVMNNPYLYLENRVCTFLSTNSLSKEPPQVGNGTTFFSNQQNYKSAVSDFTNNNYLSTPININIKYKITKLLLTTNQKDDNTIASKIIWNAIPTIIIIIILGIYKLTKKQYFWVFISALVVMRTVLLFLTAPANYFMYYLPVYMSGNLIIFLCLLLYIDKKHTIKNA